MFNNHSISISVSDDESDELGKMRVPVRRKRTKPGYGDNNELTRRVHRLLVKYWMVLIFLPAAGLLVVEASRIGRRPSLVVSSEHGMLKESEIKSQENLNCLNPTTRVVGGVRERCLKLLPPEEVEHLDVSMREDISSPVKSVLYKSEKETTFLGRNATLPRQSSEIKRFNLFTGNQTLDQRDKSFKVKETAAIHCGFYSENGGFRILDEDRGYMETCNAVVSTCAFGGGDDLYQPIRMSEASVQKVCFVAFWDDVTLETQESVGLRISENHFIGKLRIVVVKDLPFSDQRLNGKIPKMLTHHLFPQAKYCIWVDSKSQFRSDPLGVLEAMLWRSKSALAISEHGAHSSVYDEAKAVVKKNKATPEEVEVQLSQYRHDGLPDDKRFNGKKVPLESSSKSHSRNWLALSLYIQQSHSASSNVQHPAVQPDSTGAFIFHRTLTEGPANTSRVVGRAQGFIIPTEVFAHSAFNVIYLSFEGPQYSGSLSVQANHLSDKEKEQELVVVGGTGSFAFARGLAVLAQTHDQQLPDHAVGTYHVKLELRFPKGARTTPG